MLFPVTHEATWTWYTPPCQAFIYLFPTCSPGDHPFLQNIPWPLEQIVCQGHPTTTAWEKTEKCNKFADEVHLQSPEIVKDLQSVQLSGTLGNHGGTFSSKSKAHTRTKAVPKERITSQTLFFLSADLLGKCFSFSWERRDRGNVCSELLCPQLQDRSVKSNETPHQLSLCY